MSDADRAALVAEAGVREQLASTELYRVCDPGQHFRMSIPADENRDSDLLIGASLADIPALLAIIEADGKRLALAEKTIADAATALDLRGIPFGADMLAVWDRHIAEAKATLRNYDAAKEGFGS